MLFSPRIKKEKIRKKRRGHCIVIISFVTQLKSLKTAEKSLCHILLPTGSLFIMHLLYGAFVDLLPAVYCRYTLLYSRLHPLPSSSYYPFFDIHYPPRKQQIFHTLQLIRYRLTVQSYFAISIRSPLYILLYLLQGYILFDSGWDSVFFV